MHNNSAHSRHPQHRQPHCPGGIGQIMTRPHRIYRAAFHRRNSRQQLTFDRIGRQFGDNLIAIIEKPNALTIDGFSMRRPSASRSMLAVSLNR